MWPGAPLPLKVPHPPRCRGGDTGLSARFVHYPCAAAVAPSPCPTCRSIAQPASRRAHRRGARRRCDDGRGDDGWGDDGWGVMSSSNACPPRPPCPPLAPHTHTRMYTCACMPPSGPSASLRRHICARTHKVAICGALYIQHQTRDGTRITFAPFRTARARARGIVEALPTSRTSTPALDRGLRAGGEVTGE